MTGTNIGNRGMRYRKLRLGYRGAFLLLMAAIFIETSFEVYGLRSADVDLVAFRLPIWIEIGVWAVPAVVAIVCAFLHTDWPAFTLLMIAPVLHTASFAWGAFVWETTNGARGEDFAFESIPTYVLVIGLILLIGRWPEPAAIRTVRPGE